MYHHRHGSSIPMLFSTPFDEAEVYPFAASSASVDCTLSLGTPSTRLVEDDERRVFHERRLSDGSCMTGFCLDLSQNGKQHPATTQKNVNNYNSGSGADPLLARRCANCDTTSTPLWRNGPRGPKSLCNACGIRFKKEERRAIAASDTPMSSAGPTAPLIMDPQQMINNSWIHNTDTQRMHCLSPAISNEFRFIEDNRYESDNTGYQFPPWRLNVTDRPGLVHDFTR